MQYGVASSELLGVLASILGDVPDETMESLLKQGLRAMADMTLEEFMSLPGIGRERAVRLTAAFDLARRMARIMPENRSEIRSPEDAASLVMEDMRYLNREHFVVLLLNTKNHVIARELISIGTLNSSSVHPRELFKPAIRRSAASIILVHNHPSGDPEPSTGDCKVTERLVEIGELMGIEVLDHLVIGDQRFVSFKQKGLL
ncbi:MAG: JAB domain-containing protein [Firmicutes bacterium]|nr:JAB domain-containing protein [Bacillota bacterium]